MGRASKSGIKGLSKRGGRWVIDLRWTEPGTGERRRYQEILPGGKAVKAETARKRAQEVLNKALAGGWDPKREQPKTLAEALDEYLEWAKVNKPRSYQSRQSIAKVLRAKLGEDKALDSLCALDVERFKRVRVKELAQRKGIDVDAEAREGEPDPAELVGATVNRAVAMLKHLCGLAVTWGWMGEEEARRVRAVKLLKEPPGRVRFLSAEEASRLSGELAEERQAPVRRVVVTVMLTGLRMGEAVGLKKEQVDLAHRQINLGWTKNGERRTVPINDALAAVLEEALKASPEKCAAVFTNTKGQPITKRGLHAVYFRAVKRANIKDLDFHDLRHHAATGMRRQGVGLDVIARILGHNSLAMTQRYAHLSDEQAVQAVASLQSLPPAPPKPATETKSKRKAEPKAPALVAVAL